MPEKGIQRGVQRGEEELGRNRDNVSMFLFAFPMAVGRIREEKGE